MCLFTNTSEVCNHPECLSYRQTHQMFQIPNSALIGNIGLLIQQQTLALSNILANNQLLNLRLETLEQSLQHFSRPKIVQIVSCTDENSFHWLHSDQNFSFFLVLQNSFPEIIYKERGFPLQISIVNASGEKSCSQETLGFVIEVFTVENPPKALKMNISEKKILRGTVKLLVKMVKFVLEMWL